MVEGGAAEASEKPTSSTRSCSRTSKAQPILELIEKMRAAVGKPKREFITPEARPPTSRSRVAELVDGDIREAPASSKRRSAATTATPP